jgi:hypothetical protein
MAEGKHMSDEMLEAAMRSVKEGKGVQMVPCPEPPCMRMRRSNSGKGMDVREIKSDELKDQ